MSVDHDPQDHSAAAAPSRAGVRWWPVAAILGLTVAELAWIWLLSGMNRAYCVLGTISAIALALVLLICWWAFLSRLSRSLRVAGVIVAGVAVLAGVLLLRVDGVSGDFVPTLAWRWKSAPRLTLPGDREGSQEVGLVDLTQTTPDDYPQFLGPNRRATLDGPRLARDWSAQPPRELWRHPVGQGWSSFAVVGSYALTQEQRDDQELVVCYDLQTGETLWAHADQRDYESVVAGDGPRATPTVHEGLVYTLGASGLLNCLDGATGQPLWSRDVLTEFDAVSPQWGKSCSPLIVDNLVVVSAGATNGRSLVAFDRLSGEFIWGGGDDRSGYSSPTLGTLAGRRQILIFNQSGVAAHDPERGDVLWEYPWPDANPNVAQPVVLEGDRVFISTGYGIGCELLRIEADPAGELTAHSVWGERNRNLKTKFTNVVVFQDHIYGLDEGILTCIEIESGDRAWKAGRYGHGQILLVDDVILVQAESGDVVLVEATPEELRELTRFAPLDGKTWNNPALAGRLLLVRNAEEAACFELPLAE